MSALRTLVIIPTYNEKENIVLMLAKLFEVLPSVDALVVDDNSPDGTMEVVRGLAKENPRLFSLLRQEKTGLGAAYVDAFRWTHDKNYEVIVQMDADLSHRPADLSKILEQLSEAEAVVGSRYVVGGEIRNWDWTRRGLSYFGNAYARFFLGGRVQDWTSGFVAWKASALHKVDLSKIASSGYAFQIELKHKALQAGLRLHETPIVFEDVREGDSKMNAKIAFEALYQVAFLGLKSLM